MSDQDNAAQADTGIVIEGEEQTIENNQSESQQVESATTEEVKADEKPNDGVQTRFNKLTADKYAGKRREADLQKRINELEAAKPDNAIKKPVIVGDRHKFSLRDIAQVGSRRQVDWRRKLR